MAKCKAELSTQYSVSSEECTRCSAAEQHASRQDPIRVRRSSMPALHLKNIVSQDFDETLSRR